MNVYEELDAYEELADKSVEALTDDDVEKIKIIVGTIIAIDSVPVIAQIAVHRRSIRIWFEMDHPTSLYTITLCKLSGSTLRECLKLINELHISRVVNHKGIQISEPNFADFVTRHLDASHLKLSLDLCSVCREYTTYKLDCKHHLCPFCLHRCARCPLCRASFTQGDINN